MAKFKAAEARLFRRMFVCKDCHSKIRADNLDVTQGNIKCRNCNSRDLRPVRKQ